MVAVTIYLSIANMKGGVGKSTTAMMLADTLSAHHRQRVLVVDCDAQANCSQMILGSQGLRAAAGQRATLTHWLEDIVEKGSGDFFGAVRPCASGLEEIRINRSSSGAPGFGDVALVPATPELRFAELAFDHKSFDKRDSSRPRQQLHAHLCQGLSSLGSFYDVVIFDCPPGFTTIAQAALIASNAVISPINEDPVSLWSLVAFRDFGLTRTLDKWEANAHRVLFTKVNSAGAAAARAKVRSDVRSAGFNMLPVHIRHVSQAVKWVQRPAADSYSTFAEKYGPARQEVQALGQATMEFLAGVNVQGEANV